MPGASGAPAEIVDLVIDFLHDDRASLLSTSLVSRKWVPASRWHLFGRLALHHFRNEVDGRFISNISGIQALLQSQLCTFVSSVRGLLLNLEEDWAAKVFDGLHLAPVQRLILVDRTEARMKPLKVAWIAEAFRGIEELVYNALDRFSGDVLEMVVRLPKLRVLCLYSRAKEGGAKAISHAGSLPLLTSGVLSQLEVLMVRLPSYETDKFFKWILTAHDLSGLHTLDVTSLQPSHYGWGPVQALNKLIARTGSQLRHLSLAIAYEDHRSTFDRRWMLRPSSGSVNLGPLTNLSTLKVAIHDEMALCDLLGTVAPGVLDNQTLTMSFLRWPYRSRFRCPCHFFTKVEKIGATLRLPAFRYLSQLEILISSLFENEDRQRVRECFINQCASGALVLGLNDGPGDCTRWPENSWERLQVNWGQAQQPLSFWR